MNKRRREIMNAMQPVVDVALARPAVVTGVTARVLNAATTEVTIYGAIGGGGWDDTSVSASGMKQVLDAITTPNIDLHMNSGGGDVFDGTAIHTLIARHPAVVHGTVDGIAASAASFIMMACDKITTVRNGLWMIHDGMTVTYGGPATHQRNTDLLNKVSDNIADMYAVRAGGTAEDWRATMSKNGEDGTWYTGVEAVEAGLADSVSDDESDDPDVEDRARRILAHVGTGAPAYVTREREDIPVEPVLDPRDEQARTMLAFLAERMKGRKA
jgi:ATP-dependent protease ClpP protease subunit